jgi:hypothetical protein
MENNMESTMERTQDQVQAQKEKINAMAVEFSKDLDVMSFVLKTEGRIASTKDHYGDYMSFLSPYAGKPVALYIMSRACILAGANANGVSWAVQLIKG